MSGTAKNTDLMIDGLDRVAEAAQFLKLSQSTIYGLMDRGLLAYVKFGKARRIPHRSVIDYAAKNLVSRRAD